MAAAFVVRFSARMSLLKSSHLTCSAVNCRDLNSKPTFKTITGPPQSCLLNLVDMKWMKTGDVEKRHKETKSVPTPTTTPKLGTKKD